MIIAAHVKKSFSSSSRGFFSEIAGGESLPLYCVVLQHSGGHPSHDMTMA